MREGEASILLKRDAARVILVSDGSCLGGELGRALLVRHRRQLLAPQVEAIDREAID